ncbi:unnamed protein product [Closterium sp. NIES-54]
MVVLWATTDLTEGSPKAIVIGVCSGVRSQPQLQLPRTGVCTGRVRLGPTAEAATSDAAEPAAAAATAAAATAAAAAAVSTAAVAATGAVTMAAAAATNIAASAVATAVVATSKWQARTGVGSRGLVRWGVV